MAKEIISATINTDTADKVRKLAEKEKRSFSQMVDLLLCSAIGKIKSEKRKMVDG